MRIQTPDEGAAPMSDVSDVAGPGDRAGEIMADFAAFVNANLSDLLRYGHALTGSPHDAADLVQTVLEKIGARWAKLTRQGVDPLMYVRRAMANANVSRWRRRRREVLVDVVPERGGAAADPMDGEPLWRALTDLPPRQRAVIVLRYYEDLSQADIARVLDISEGTVKSQTSKALTKLRSSVGRWGGGDHG